MIQFSEISNFRIPLAYVEFDSSLAGSGLGGTQPYKVLLLGEKLLGSPAGLNTPYRLYSEADAKKQFGDGSVLHQMTKVYFKACQLEVWAVALAESKDGTSLANPKPDIAQAFVDIDGTQFNVMACAYSEVEPLRQLGNELQSRASAKRQIEGFAVAALNKGVIDGAAVSKQLNSPYLSVLPTCKSESKPWELAASLAGVLASQANIDPARPIQTLVLPDIKAPDNKEIESRATREAALRDGLSTFYVDAGGNVRIERLITAYRTNALGAEDLSYLNPSVPLTLSFIRWDFRRYFMTKYPRHKLASDNFKGKGAVMTPKLAKAEAICLAREWEEQGLIQDLNLFQEGLITEIAKDDPTRLNLSMSPKLVSQFCVLGAKVSFLL
jgi:phage tail sheath gpL-like